MIVARSARDLAIAIVDGLRGYTMEFAASPEQHRAEWDVAEEQINAFMAAQRAEVATPSHEALRLARETIARRTADGREKECDPADWFDYVVAKELLRCYGPSKP